MAAKIRQVFATTDQILNDLKSEENNNPNGITDRLMEASRSIRGKIGSFIPMIESRSFSIDLHLHPGEDYPIPPLLTISSVKIDGTETDEYTLNPDGGEWSNGPYTRIRFDHYVRKDQVITILGSWGLYNETKELGLSATQELSDENLEVIQGGVISPGMVILIDGEQEFISAGNGTKGSPSPGDSTITLAEELTDLIVEQIITVSDGSKLFENEVIRIDSENLFVERISGNEITVMRGWNQTLTATHAAESKIFVYRSYQVERCVNGSEISSHSNAEISEYVIPEDVNWLCRQITALMIKKANSGFQGRIGNPETGETTFYSEFPPNQIEFVKDHYRL